MAVSPLQQVRSEIVSDAAERLILVDGNDTEVGVLDKQSCHNGDGVLHRAFSLFIFNSHGDLLLQKRAPDKRLWPEYWSNSCCSHPREGEAMPLAVQRRCQQELGFTTPLQFMYKFEYSARFRDQGCEHELCSVYAGRFDGRVDVNTSEIEAWRWCSPTELDRQFDTEPEKFTPWFKLEWQRLRAEFTHLFSGQRSGQLSDHLSDQGGHK